MLDKPNGGQNTNTKKSENVKKELTHLTNNRAETTEGLENKQVETTSHETQTKTVSNSAHSHHNQKEERQSNSDNTYIIQSLNTSIPKAITNQKTPTNVHNETNQSNTKNNKNDELKQLNNNQENKPQQSNIEPTAKAKEESKGVFSYITNIFSNAFKTVKSWFGFTKGKN